MLRKASQGFSFLVKNDKRMPFLSQRLDSHLRKKYLFSTENFSTEFNDKLASGKFYEVLGYPQGTDLSALTDAQVKRQYLSMVKKYHSDVVVDPVQKVKNEEITKCIIQAFDRISSDRIRVQINKGIYDKIYKDEDEIAMKIYGKKFNEIKYDLFKEGNAAKRTEFMDELQKIRKDSKYYDHIKDRQAETSANFNQQREAVRPPNLNVKLSNDFGSGMMKIWLPIFGIFGALAY